MSGHGTHEGPTDAPRTRGFTPARIVALVISAILVAALAYLRFAPGSAAVSVPAGAKAGQLSLKPCTYATESGGYKADCGTLVVPENRADPQSRLIALPVKRIRARSAHPAEPVFRLEGGPGGTNMDVPTASRFADRRDVVLVGYRGVDGSVRLDCPEVDSALQHSTDVLGQKSFRAYADGFRSCAKRLRSDGVDLAGYSMAQQADDLEAARVALGYQRIDLLSESAGTRLALVYAWRYPASVARSVLIGVNPPGNFLWDPRATDQEIARYAALCAKDASCSKRTDDLAASMRRTATHIPDRWGILPIKKGNARVASFLSLFETSSALAPINAPTTISSWLSAAEGDASGFWFASLAGDLLFPSMFVWGEYAAVGSADDSAATAYYGAGGDPGSILGDPGTSFVWADGKLVASWPAAPDAGEYSRVRTSRVETLLVGGALDVSTPPQIATKELLPFLPNGRQVVLPGFGHTASFWKDQPKAGTRLINTFLDSGRVDDSLYKPQSVDFTPGVTQTTFAKLVVGLMVGFALVAVLSLVWMALRVRRRGGYGRRASAVLRSVFPIVIGLGGWFLGALIVLITLPGVRINNQALAAISVGLPVGLGIYLAWVRRDRPGSTRTTGFAAATAGALLGAWLGFHATGGLFALVTAIVGAVVGANLVLMALDITWDLSSRTQLAAIGAPASLAPAGAGARLPEPRRAGEVPDKPVGTSAEPLGDDPRSGDRGGGRPGEG